MNMNNLLRNERGFTLIEVLIATTLLAVGILGVTKLQLSFMQSNTKASIVTTGSAQAQSVIEELLTVPFDDGRLTDDDGDGTDEDADKDGVDDDGDNFGLDHVGAAADETEVRGSYTFYWNIAEDHPTTGAKTINVIVQWTEYGVLRSINYSIIKAEI